MKREDMERRLEEGEDPLELSIEKWKDIINGDGYDHGSGNCALCSVYYNGPTNCENCPVCIATGHSNCEETPYDNYEDSLGGDPVTINEARRIDAKRARNMLKVAKKELEFLKSLRPKQLNVVDKFREWFTALPVTEQRDLYDILALLRGPDDYESTAKDEFTCRIRHMLGVMERTGDTRDYPHEHVKQALKRLKDLGILK